MLKRVLFLETEFMNRLLMQRMVEANGCECVFVESPEMIWPHLYTQTIDLILLTMSHTDSLAVAQQLKKHLIFQEIPVVAIVQTEEQGLKEQAYLAGCEAFLEKPAGILQIQAMLDEVLQLPVKSLVGEETLQTFVAAW